jgi:hypothetical protein
MLGRQQVLSAACITNPAFGRGISLGLVHTFALTAAIAEGLEQPENLATPG